MQNITVSAFRWAPPFAQGLVRDLRVRWALEEAGLAYGADLIAVEDRGGDAYRRKNPFGMVPAFEMDGVRAFESGAILLQIAERSAALMPQDPQGRADTLTWMFAALSTIEPRVQALSELDLQHSDEAWARLRRPSLVEAVQARLDVLSAWLDGRDYLLGRFTAADILMVGVLRLIRHTDLATGMPILRAYLARCESRPAFGKALADQMACYAENAPVAA